MSTTMKSFLALAMFCLAPALMAQAVVPETMAQNGALEQVRAGFQAGRVSTLAVDKLVRIEWTAMALMNGAQATEIEWGNPAYKWATSTQEFTTRYWPTACCVVDNSSLVVCGKTQAGGTIIEHWTLEWPVPMPAPFTNPQSGVTSVGIALPTIGVRTELYKADVAGMRLVTNACGIRRSNGSSEALLLQFHDSNDVYALHMGTKAMTLLASGSNSNGTLGLVPALAAPKQDYIEFGDKIAGTETGYTYTFGFSNWGTRMVNFDPSFQTLILLDTDRDGVVETTRYYTNTELEAGGWTTPTNFANYWKP